ncbi:MAG: hypothetical protein A3I77_00675 [Gammaproteobacteria bacterium RIFCSPLOWO2_02_FULL_42_14]|nr:MAG: hypothetical protein A3B71_08760 [Gammaproteobacteria bacterium RIFCSPHIGHO2_02_FULL_42_43]OGT28594.1 MAG: hypothetical protein A2624_06510 [Gammaproteobacteria bacterium RIFCSPHIGHO2_01_FULL_42_8]OGT50798.1 MAG: hypothetical protein A3E54_00955 [Gammaproteobacteria bacterium RIFCSPHIGHO2_12_FULL_41_25]OGT61782.1 MAG: hypothetical protein A3I77_00675 [Gammaproteobacteria bacterium RIFCSPLOWO2_02_FULL_42_14]OGT85527.1 MAG: hypothetical protein A3G86_06865 [Gammaproteobacteria bacterium R
MMGFYMRNRIKAISNTLIPLGYSAGIFFPVVNFVWSLDQGKLDEHEFWDWVANAFAVFAVISTVAIPALKSYGKAPSMYDQLPRDENSQIPAGPNRLNRIGITWENALSTLSAPGAVVGALNIARFDPRFKELTQKNSHSQIAYALASALITLLTIEVALLRNKIKDTVWPMAFHETCGKAGAWIGAIFGLFLTQLVVAKQDNIPPAEVAALSIAMAALFATDMLLLGLTAKSLPGHANLSKIEQAKNFISARLDSESTTTQKNLWRAQLVMDTLRELVGVFGLMLSVPNILSLSPGFNALTGPLSLRDVYGSLIAVSLVAGGSNAAKVIMDRRDQTVSTVGYSLNNDAV